MDRRHVLAGLAGLPLAGLAAPAPAAVDPLVAMHREVAAVLADFMAGADDGTDGDLTFARLTALREAALDVQATSLPGALAALEWARLEFASFYLDPEAKGDTVDWLDHVTLSLLDGAIGALRRAVDGVRA